MSTVSKNSAENLEIQARLDRKAARKNLFDMIIPYIGLVFCLVFFSIVTNGLFLSSKNLMNMIEQCFTLVIIAVGASFVYAQGNMDFSIGSACGVAQMVGGLLLLKLNFPIYIVIPVMILVPVASCLLVSLISAVFHVPVFIGSMCIRSLLAGLLTIGVAKAELIIPISDYPALSNDAVKILTLIAVIAVGIYFFHFHRVGKWAKLIGGNPVTAAQAGVRVKKQVFLAYAILGACVGITAVFTMFRAGTVGASSGSGIEFSMMLAIVLGGFPMSGGEKSRMVSAIVGAVTATMLTNGLALWGIDPNIIGGIKGVIFVVIIALTYDRSAGKLVS